MNNLIDEGECTSPPHGAPLRQLRQSEIRYRRLFEAARDGILILDAATRKITDVNPFMVELLGYAREEFLGKELWEIGLLKDVDTSTAAFAELQITGYIRYDDLPLQTRSGTLRDVEFVSNVYDENGYKVVQCNIRDITERKRAERATALLASIVESSEDGIVCKTLDGIITTWNAGAQALYGYTAPEVLGRPVSFLAPPELPDEMLDLLEMIRRGEPVKHYETVRVRKDGSRFDISLTISPLKDATGNIVGASSFKRDISERKEAEAALQDSQRFLQATLDALSSHIAVLAENGTVIAINKAWRQFAEDNGGTPYFCGIGSNYFDVCDSAFGACADEAPSVAHGLRDVMAGKKQLFTLEYPCHSKAEKRWFKIRATPFLGEGPVRLVVAHENVTARRLGEVEQTELQTQMEGQRQRLNTIVATVPGLVWEAWGEPDTDAQHNNFVSEYIETMLGYSVAEWLATSNFWLDIIHPDDKLRAKRQAAAVFAGGKGGTLHYRWVTKSGRAIWVESRVVIICDEAGQPVGARGVTMDISDRKEAEDSLRASEARVSGIVNAAMDGIISMDQQGMVTEFNPAAQQIFGYSREAALGQSVADLIVPPELREQHRQGLARYLETGQASVLNQRLELTAMRADGSTLPIELTITHPPLEGPPSFTGYLRDITERKQTEGSLRASEERYRSLALATAQVVWTTNAEGLVVEDLPAWRAYTGQNRQEVMGLGWLQAVHPDDREQIATAWLDAVNSRTAYDVECRLRNASGAYRFCTNRGVPVIDGEGRIREWIGTYTDITERRQAEAALRRMHEELEMRVERRTSELAGTNDELQVKIREREEAVAETRIRAGQQEAVAELGRQALTEIDIDALLTTATELVRVTLSVELSTVLELMEDGETLRIRTSVGWKGRPPEAMVLGKAKSQAGYAMSSNSPVIVSDLTEETRFEPSRLMLEQDIVSGITVVIGGQEKQFGTLGAHSTKRRIFNQNDVNFLQSISNVLAAALGQRRSNENLRIENVERQMAMGALQEVTAGFKAAKEEAEQARESADAANLAKSEFLSRMSHELRTPLNAILGFGQLLAKQDFAPAQQERVHHILKAGRHLLDLINEVLEIARIESGHMLLSLEPVQVCDTVDEVFSLLKPLAEELGVELQGCEYHQSDFVRADRQRLKQVLLNLCSNAIKYNRPGGSICVTCETVTGGTVELDTVSPKPATAPTLLRISVTDTGMGIADVDQTQLFVPFMRVGAEKTNIEGTGLGLALSRSLVHAMEGTMGLRSTVEVGSTFWLQLPLATSPVLAAQHSPAHEVEDDGAQVTPGEARYTILYIEDNLSNLQLIEAIIEDHPIYDLVTAMQGQVGLDLARQHHPDLILLDLHLPDVPGDQVLARLRADPSTAGIPVVMLSAVAVESEIKRLLAGGAVAYLTKPLDIDLFLATLGDILHPVQGSV